jgi:hypothetical protein
MLLMRFRKKKISFAIASLALVIVAATDGNECREKICDQYVISAKLTNIRYPHLSGLQAVPLSDLGSQVYCNGSYGDDRILPVTIKLRRKKSLKGCFSVEERFAAGAPVQVEGSVPILSESVNGERIRWEISPSALMSSCEDPISWFQKVNRSRTIHLSPSAEIVHSFSEYRGAVNGLKYVGVLERTYNNGLIDSVDVEGTYDGDSTLEVQESWCCSAYNTTKHHCTGMPAGDDAGLADDGFMSNSLVSNSEGTAVYLILTIVFLFTARLS